MPRRFLPPPLTIGAGLTLAGGLAASLLLFAAVSRLELANQTLAFQQRASLRATVIGHGLDDAVEVLQVANQLFATVQPVSRQQFHDFTGPLLARHHFIQAFNFHRVLSDAE